MKKHLVFMTLFVFLFSLSALADTEKVNTPKTPKLAPIERAHIVEDYLPILGKKMREHGLTPPKPFFITAIYYHMEIPQNITNARGWGFFGFTEENAVPVRMENAKIETNSAGFRAGFNLFPFLSVFGVYMHTEGASKFTAVADGNPAMPNGYMLQQTLRFKADTGAIGVALAYGYRLGRVVPFAVLNGNYAWSFTDRTDNVIQTIIAGARAGVAVPLPKGMKIAASIGTQYQYMPMGNEVSGSYTVTLPGGTIVGQPDPVTITSRYKANAEYANPWVMNAGLVFSPNKYCDIITEFGFLSRFTAMVAVQANF